MNSISVSRLLAYLKNKLDGDANLHNFLIGGEISNYHKQQASGHVYFTLKDETSQIACVMFRSYALKLLFEPKNGDKVLVRATASIFEASGQLQLYVSEMKPDGLGELYLKYEALKNKLEKEGYFEESHKKPLLNRFPERVAVLVGDKSAAMSDIKTAFARRWPLCKADYYPVIVQGNEAPSSIIKTLKETDKLNYDFIIIARGGGSFEDLFCFNDEELVKTIYNLKTFTVSGVGHQQDYTLCDFVADLRAATPTASVELITPDVNELLNYIYDMRRRLFTSMALKQASCRDNYERLVKSSVFTNPHAMTEKQALKLDYATERLHKFRHVVITYRNLLENDCLKMKHALKLKINENVLNIRRLTALVKAYSYENILNRGYSISFKDGKVIRSIKEININDEIQTRFKDGLVTSRVKELKNG